MIQTQPTLTYQQFTACVRAAVPRFTMNWLNMRQDVAVSAPPSPPVFIVAGPGTGKTTVLALRVLRHVFVDGFSPTDIIATTFTKKAAKELRSRILSWGALTHAEATRRALQARDKQRAAWLAAIDINMIKTGTLDSLAEDMIRNDRQPGEITPAVIEQFLAAGLLRRRILFPGARHADATLVQHLRNFNPRFPSANGFAERLYICHSFAERALHDGIDLSAYSAAGPGHQLLGSIVEDYHTYLRNAQLMDFAMLEQTLLERLQQGRLQSTTATLRALLVDEFQDTNYLQEQIYYALCQRSDAALTVVGDDDQSVYRFRGATVEIFADFENRLVSSLGIGWTPQRVDLIDNYRSNERIVSFFNSFAAADPDFQSARAPGKLACVASAPWARDPNQNYPVLGLFRASVGDLATDLCQLLGDIFRGNGFSRPVASGTLTIRQGQGGDFGDAVLLAWKVREIKDDGTPRLPLLMRQGLLANFGVEVFNPRGRQLRSIPEMTRLLGLMLECIDPNGVVQNSITTMRPATRAWLDSWRLEAQQFIASNPSPGGLPQFVADWTSRTPRNMGQWPREWPLLELMFTLQTWFPFLQNSPEGQVYLEALARIIAEAAQLSPYESMLLTSGSAADQRAITAAIREVFEAIGEGNADIDEEIMPYVPRSTFPIMTIHQAKGLEFPLVIVDVGSDYRQNNAAQRQSRHPTEGDNGHYTEDHTAPFSPVGPARTARSRRQRAFDDIRRLYYVASSRPHTVLILAGLTTQLGNPPRVQSVATGDRLDNTRAFQFIPAAQWSVSAPDASICLI